MDRVQVIKQERSGQGGDDADIVEFLNAPIEPQEDAIEAAGYFVQSPTARDFNVLISRDASDNLTFKDVANPTPRTLTELLGTAGIYAAYVDVVIPQGTDVYHGSVTSLSAAPALVVPSLGRDISSQVIDEDMSFEMTITSLNSNGFDYIVRIYDEGEMSDWPDPDVTVRFDYIWRE